MTLDTLLKGVLTRHFSEHLEATNVSQTYDEHQAFAAKRSWGMIVAGVKGLIHSINPKAYPFDGSTTIITYFKDIVDSRRHVPEINRIMPGYLNPRYIEGTGERNK